MLVAAFGVSVLAVGLVLRSSLSEQLTGVRRPHATGRIAMIIQLALVAGALSVLAAKLSVSRPGRPDVTDLVLPVLLAVVAGLAATQVHGQARRLVDQGPAPYPLVARVRRGPGHQPADGGHARHPAGHGRDRGLRLRRGRP